jgi:hypothetical protein
LLLHEHLLYRSTGQGQVRDHCHLFGGFVWLVLRVCDGCQRDDQDEQC